MWAYFTLTSRAKIGESVQGLCSPWWHSWTRPIVQHWTGHIIRNIRILFICYGILMILAQLAELVVQPVKSCLSVCLSVNQGWTEYRRCMQRLVILRAQTYWWTGFVGHLAYIAAQPAERQSPWAACVGVSLLLSRIADGRLFNTVSP